MTILAQLMRLTNERFHLAVANCNARDANNPNRVQSKTVGVPSLLITTPVTPIPASLSTSDQELSEDCRQKYFLDYYFGSIASVISIKEGPNNQFGESLKQYMSRSHALRFTIVAMAAMLVADSKVDSSAVGYAWHYRTIALGMLQKDILQQSYSIEILATVLFLGTTEFWFDAKSSGSVHLNAAKQLLLHNINSGVQVPLFLANFLCWFETMSSFVSDDEGLVFSSPATYVSLNAGGNTARGDYDTIFDPLVGNWGTLMPLVGRVGTIVRKLRKGTELAELDELIDTAEIDLLEWEHSDPPLNTHDRPTPSDTSCAQEFYSIAETYRLSALLALYNYSPRLLIKRATLVTDVKTAAEFLSQLACSTIALLRQIPIDSRLWFVCSIPILSAGQLMTKSCDREFLRSVLSMLMKKTRLTAAEKVGQLLEDVWERRDAGSEIWWMDILDETGNPMLIN
ncbi:hypothetical protein BP5796_13221 [Coleophoma crateriformis]|uniref:Uncharacterized protein n=1 Tax=Coleophoma crateriformis TaxID=565419 RepID=A0A3D8Q3D7_9HELO|nr:hypothetical protein BP5796_13221 [Coleophoma crateriformis]